MGYYVPPVPPVPYVHPVVAKTEISRQSWTLTTTSSTYNLTIPNGTLYIVVTATSSTNNNTLTVQCALNRSWTATNYEYSIMASATGPTTLNTVIPVHGSIASIQLRGIVGGAGAAKVITVVYYK